MQAKGQEIDREKKEAQPQQFQLIAQPEPKRVNLAGFHARRGLKSEISRCDAKLQTDLASVLSGHCIYFPGFFAQPTDFSLLQALTVDLAKNDQTGMVNWSQHLKHDNPDFSNCFKSLLDRMATFFDVEIYATRLNFYPDASAWKPYHHDSHAYGGRQMREDFTMGASFGFERKLSFLHPESMETFEFPQINGDIFAFTTEANKRFQHGVPKCKAGSKSGPRFSIIAWGRRRTINERNAALDELNAAAHKQPLTERAYKPSPVAATAAPATAPVTAAMTAPAAEEMNKLEKQVAAIAIAAPQEKAAGGCGCGGEEATGAVVMHAQEVSRIVDEFTTSAATTAAKANPWAANKSRVQGGWAGKTQGKSRIR